MQIKAESFIADALDPASILHANGITPAPWQAEALLHWQEDHQLLCCRQSGKTTLGAAMALHAARWGENQPVPIVSGKAQRQAGELFQKCKQFARNVPSMPNLIHDTADRLEFENGSRILALPADPDSVRGIGNAAAVIIDEAAYADDAIMAAVEPMLSVSGGPLWIMSTPNGQRGFFWRLWTAPESSFRRVKITWNEAAHLSPKFVEKVRGRMPPWQFQQEYECRFTANELSPFDVEMWRKCINPVEATLWPEDEM